MSPREKRLLILFLAGGLVMANVLAFTKYQSLRATLDDQRIDAERKVQIAAQFQTSREQVLRDMEWLDANEPEPADKQDVQVALQAFCKQEADQAGLEVRKQKLEATEATAEEHFHRARIEVDVSGTEEALYQWLDRINTPNKFRAATRLVLSPDPKDETRIDCKATIEQWFNPKPSA